MRYKVDTVKLSGFPGQCRHDKQWLNGHGHTCEVINKNPDSKGDWRGADGEKAGDYCSKFCAAAVSIHFPYTME